MRGIIFVALVALSAVVAEELYSDRYDYIDVDDIVNNPRLREQYYKCFFDSGQCITADAKFFAEIFPDAILRQCKRCTAKQSTNLGKLVDWYTTHEPEKWNALVAQTLKKFSQKSS